jgi:serine/threonine protein kinase
MSSSQVEESNTCTQYDQQLTQTHELGDTNTYSIDKDSDSDPVWASLISRSVHGIHIQLLKKPADGEGRYNMELFGRGSSCSIRFQQSPRISNKHCMIYCKLNNADISNPILEPWIVDLSANGTFINRTIRLVKDTPRLLHHRDEIFLVNPDLARQVNASSAIAEDIALNSFVVMLNLPMPQVDELIATARTRSSHFNISLMASSSLHFNSTPHHQYNNNHNNHNNNHGVNSGTSMSIGTGIVHRTSTVNRLLSKCRNIHDFYEIRALLGTGTSGQVYHAISKENGMNWAVKRINIKQYASSSSSSLSHHGKQLATTTTTDITKEAEMLRTLRHPNIIHLEDIFADGEHLYLVMEMSLGGDLFDRIVQKKHYREDEAKVVFKQILQAIEYLHENKIAHRDLKPENILLVSKRSDVDIKLTDFGLAKRVDESGRMNTFCGTPQYYAPEVLNQRSNAKSSSVGKTAMKNNHHGINHHGMKPSQQKSYSLKADMWSLGVILFVMLEGNYPFQEVNLNQSIATGSYSFNAPVWKTVSIQAKELIQRMLIVNPTNRITAKEALASQWFSPIDQTVNRTVNGACELPQETNRFDGRKNGDDGRRNGDDARIYDGKAYNGSTGKGKNTRSRSSLAVEAMVDNDYMDGGATVSTVTTVDTTSLYTKINQIVQSSSMLRLNRDDHPHDRDRVVVVEDRSSSSSSSHDYMKSCKDLSSDPSSSTKKKKNVKIRDEADVSSISNTSGVGASTSTSKRKATAIGALTDYYAVERMSHDASSSPGGDDHDDHVHDDHLTAGNGIVQHHSGEDNDTLNVSSTRTTATTTTTTVVNKKQLSKRHKINNYFHQVKKVNEIIDLTDNHHHHHHRDEEKDDNNFDGDRRSSNEDSQILDNNHDGIINHDDNQSSQQHDQKAYNNVLAMKTGRASRGNSKGSLSTTTFATAFHDNTTMITLTVDVDVDNKNANNNLHRRMTRSLSSSVK